MTTFYVVVETVKSLSVDRNIRHLIFENKRVEPIEADDIDEAWRLARIKWYFGGSVNEQIVDIYLNPPVIEEHTENGESPEKSTVTEDTKVTEAIGKATAKPGNGADIKGI